MFGSTLAPGFEEDLGRFYSTDASWEWVLNSWLAMSLGPALTFGVFAFAYKLINWLMGKVVAPVRYAGHSDKLVRTVIWVVMMLPHLSLVLLNIAVQ